MTDRVAVRQATPDDAPALARLRWHFRAALGTPVETETEFVARCEAWMSARLGPAPEWRAWVATAPDGAVVGTAWVGLIDKLPNPAEESERHAYVTNVYVRPEWRGGVGARLVAAALAWCEEAGVHAAILWPTERSAALYRRHGFTEPSALLEREMGPGPERGDVERDIEGARA